MAESDDDQIDAWKLLNSELSARLTRQDASMARVETKAIVVLGFAATAAQFLSTKNPFKTPWSILFAVLAFVAYGLAFAVGIWSFRVAKFADLEGRRLLQLHTESELELLGKLIGTREEIFTRNAKSAKKKAQAWWWSLYLLAAGLLSSTFCIVHTA
jgi:hypothetical protein